MAQYSDDLLLTLVEASFALNDEKKAWILNNFEEIPLAKRRKAFEILVAEQKEHKRLNDVQIGLNKKYLHDQTVLINQYNEDLTELNEKNALEGLESAFDGAFSS